jgi:zinc protease
VSVALAATLAVGLAHASAVATADADAGTGATAAPPVVRRAGPAGSLLIVESNHTVPLVRVVVAARDGSAADPRHREGLTNLAAEMARRGAGGRTREEVDAALDALGATLEVRTEPDSTRFEGEVLARNLDAYLAILADVVARPSFDAAELARTKRELGAQIDELRTDDQALCARYFARNVYGEHPYGHPPEGLKPALAAATGEEVAAQFHRLFVGRNLIVAVAGDVDADDFAARFAHALGRHGAALREGPAPGPNALELRDPVPPKGWRIQLVDKPERQQTQLMFGHPALRASDPDYLPLSVGIATFGGHGMSARLMSEVRTKRGLAYGAYMSLAERRGVGAASGWVFSGTEKTVATLKLVLRLYVAFMEKGLTADEVDFFKRFLIGSYASEMDIPEHRLDARVSAEVAGLPVDFVDTYTARVRALGEGEVNAAIKRHVHARDLAITMVASAATMKKLLLDAKLADSAIDVVPFEGY